MKHMGKEQYTGCLLGGAAGDALGWPVEFETLDEIRSLFGPSGIRVSSRSAPVPGKPEQPCSPHLRWRGIGR